MQGIFMGEEFSRASRLWTNGYDMYAITRPVIVTYYGAEKKNMEGFSHGTPEESKRARERQATLVRFQKADLSDAAVEKLKGYNLGTRRDFADYIDITGVDTVHHKYGRKPCYVKRWYPWKEGSQPPYEALKESPLHAGKDIRTLLEAQGDVPTRPPAPVEDVAEDEEIKEMDREADEGDDASPGDANGDEDMEEDQEDAAAAGAQSLHEAASSHSSKDAKTEEEAPIVSSSSAPSNRLRATQTGAESRQRLPLGLQSLIWDSHGSQEIQMVPVTIVVGSMLLGILVFLWASKKWCRRKRATKKK